MDLFRCDMCCVRAGEAVESLILEMSLELLKSEVVHTVACRLVESRASRHTLCRPYKVCRFQTQACMEQLFSAWVLQVEEPRLSPILQHPASRWWAGSISDILIDC